MAVYRAILSFNDFRDHHFTTGRITGPHFSYLWRGDDGEQRPYWLHVTHEGKVLFEREQNGYSDSDFYACYWNEEKGCISETLFGSTRGWTYLNGCSADATPEIREKAKAYQERREAERREAEWKREQATPRKGRIVRVHTGHNRVPVDTEGRVFWVGKSKYPPYQNRLGVKDRAGNKWWVDSDKVKVISPI